MRLKLNSMTALRECGLPERFWDASAPQLLKLGAHPSLLSQLTEWRKNCRKNPSEGLLFLGGTGSGKSLICALVVKSLIAHGYSVLHLTREDLVSAFRERREQLQPAMLMDFLSLDGLPAQKLNHLEVDAFRHLLSSRRDRNRSTLLTCAAPSEQWELFYGVELSYILQRNFQVVSCNLMEESHAG